MVSEARKKLSATYVEMIRAVDDLPPVSETYIGLALEKIEAGEEKCEMQPSGTPKLRALYDIALRLESEATKKN